MPTDRIHVNRVDFDGVVKGNFKCWLVSGEYTDGRLGGFCATTLSPFAATLCEEAAKSGHDLLLQWREIPQGRGITYVESVDDDKESRPAASLQVCEDKRPVEEAPSRLGRNGSR